MGIPLPVDAQMSLEPVTPLDEPTLGVRPCWACKQTGLRHDGDTCPSCGGTLFLDVYDPDTAPVPF